ncbi:hypothetical protein BAC1_01519 [uncultured bacterium]|nr:hypothetical protein BAC1_01519 [uncultured bacterium]
MIPSQLGVAYTTLAIDLQTLKSRVDSILKAYAEERDGQYASRIKTADSIFEKAVLGSYKKLTDIEDLFASTIILSTTPIGSALTVLTESLSEHFVVHKTNSNRTRQPTEFIYDDLHYILSLKDSPLLLNKYLLAFRFELQVKSYLRHGWAKATHDTIYKSPIESWRASRVAAQTRAALEMIEAALATGENLLPDEAAQRYKPIDERIAVLGILLNWWHGPFPENRRRLGIFTLSILEMANLTLEAFSALLETQRARELQNIRSLPVQQAILVILIENSFNSIISKVQKKGNSYLVITREMEDVSEKCKQIPFDIRFELP